MALTINSDHIGIPVDNAYVTVVVPSVDKTSMLFGVYFRAKPGADPFKAVTHEAPYDLEGENPYKQAYAFLKGLDGFAGCADA